MARFYRLELHPDLFGGRVLVRHWGRIGTRGNERRIWFGDDTAALAARDKWRDRKVRRGYVTQ